MIVPAQLTQKHNLFRPYLEQIEERVKGIIFAYCSARGYAFIGRLKDAESLFEKIETGRFSNWSGLDDLYGCSIVIPFIEAEAEVIEWLKSEFDVIDLKLRGATQKDPTVFRFDATRVIARLNEPVLAANSPLAKIAFEVQIRTAFEHAWSVATHSLAYKGERVDWSRLRLAAQLKATVEQLDMLVLGFDAAAAAIHAQRWPDVAVRSKIEDLFRSRFDQGQLPAEVKPASWMRFCENVQRLILSTSPRRLSGNDAQTFVEKRLRTIEIELDKVGADYPRSLSLLQFCIGVLAETGHIEGKLHKYVPYLSPELLSLYPKSKIAGPGFDAEDTC
ncbi:RelA/SpoT domain-containing protein [Burkholderia vietnamiensis]|uniref:RelA/SpoT domain-containing protein n=1 Tax=Burkholderia vietnamiensis TaxID=60552 RepID=UPI00159338A5|nr:RelA/SpoT domain-containing protein [Burkholderia vietnamiensis]